MPRGRRHAQQRVGARRRAEVVGDTGRAAGAAGVVRLAEDRIAKLRRRRLDPTGSAADRVLARPVERQPDERVAGAEILHTGIAAARGEDEIAEVGWAAGSAVRQTGDLGGVAVEHEPDGEALARGGRERHGAVERQRIS
jgi:hypothetical protein